MSSEKDLSSNKDIGLVYFETEVRPPTQSQKEIRNIFKMAAESCKGMKRDPYLMCISQKMKELIDGRNTQES